MADERNFRSAYYEKVGFRSVEEKKSLEILLKEKPLDRGKLRQFCVRFSVPATYRNLVWKLLLGVIPVHIDSHNFIMDQRKQEYHELHRALTVMRVIDTNTPKPQVFLAMWLLQTGNFTIDTSLATERGFSNIVQSFMQFFEDDADVFWLSRNFYENVKKFDSDLGKLVEKSYMILEKEDAAYYKHLSKTGVLDNLPLAKWFDCCFAGILYKSALERIWDKLCGGSYKILAFVAVVVLTTLKARIIKCNNISAVLQIIKNITEETADVIANKSIEMWQQYGTPLTVHDKPKP
ncbi:TBC1 domain family member 7 [Diabrotica undecimpunctata]|uniref:TBC1 domain family member 7 n=1 Tax=Diabrotica undecimpunctata TaxID=50387 RepID=UPI003B6402E5